MNIFAALCICALCYFAHNRYLSLLRLEQKYRLDAMRDQIIRLEIDGKISLGKDINKLLKPIDKVIAEFEAE